MPTSRKISNTKEEIPRKKLLFSSVPTSRKTQSVNVTFSLKILNKKTIRLLFVFQGHGSSLGITMVSACSNQISSTFH